jgi:hypothetical protein
MNIKFTNLERYSFWCPVFKYNKTFALVLEGGGGDVQFSKFNFGKEGVIILLVVFIILHY